jgi:serine/threonine-protein kinase
MATIEDRRVRPVPGATMIAQRYELGQPLAQGGMATIWHGWDHRLARPVAIKTVREDRLDDDEALSRLRREAFVLATLRHPHIVDVYDLLEEDERSYLIMELVEGEDLKQWMRRHGALDPLDALDIARQICLALQKAHTHGVVHRDVKPHNILMTRGPYAKLIDFGLAFSPFDESLEMANMALGTPEYMAPEQAMGGRILATTDVYGLGITLYETLAGDVPFRNSSAMETMRQQVSANVTPLRRLRPDLPKAVETVVMRALEKDAGRRFPSAEEMAGALAEAAADARMRHDAFTFALSQPITPWRPRVDLWGDELVASEASEALEPHWAQALWAVIAVNIMLAIAVLCAIVLRAAW